MTFKRIDREIRMLSAAYAEFPLRKVLQCDATALPALVRQLRAERDKRRASAGPCPIAEKSDYGWEDGAIPSIRESGTPGSTRRLDALREWYAHQESTIIYDGNGEEVDASSACSAFIPVANHIGNIRLSDSQLSLSSERNISEE